MHPKEGLVGLVFTVMFEWLSSSYSLVPEAARTGSDRGWSFSCGGYLTSGAGAPAETHVDS